MIDVLRAELIALNDRACLYRCLVFGSVVTSTKANPGDIDILLSISFNSYGEKWKPVCDSRDLQVFPWKHQPTEIDGKVIPRTPTGGVQMVELFNKGEAYSGDGIAITIDQCVEVHL